MRVYRSFTLNVVLDYGTLAMIVNPTPVAGGKLAPGTTPAGTVLDPGQRATWICESTDFNQGVRFTASLSGPDPKPFLVSCHLPVFGHPTFNLENLPEGVMYRVESSVVEGLHATLNVFLEPEPELKTTSRKKENTMSDATVEITLHNMTADPMNVMNAPLSHGSWKNNPVGAIINVDRQHDFYAIDGTAQIQGELELDWGYKGKVTVSFHIDGDQLKYKATMEPNGVKTEKVSKTGPNAFHLTVEFI